jgi:hypothetical protein
MRVRSVVLPAVLAVAAAVLAPTAAQATPSCALGMPTKVVVDAPRAEVDVRLTNGCFDGGVVEARWNMTTRGVDMGQVVYGENVFLTDPDLYMWWDDTDPMGRWTLTPGGAVTAEGDELRQNTAVTLVKYGSDLTTKVTRTGSKLAWAVTATQWSGRTHKDVARPNASVGLFHQKPGSKTWTYVTSVTTSSTGKATVSLAAPKAGSYRLKVAETPTVWAAYSKTVQGRR